MSPPSAVPFGGDLSVADLIFSVRRFTVSGGAAFAKGEIGYIHTDGTVRKAINTSLAAARGRVMALGTIADGAEGYFLAVPGVVSGLTGGTIGALGYVGGTAGAITTTRPTGSVFLKAVGYWISTTVFAFFPEPYLEPFDLSNE